jgi:GntR family transcriptional regulator, rspAB operon transcriptional repressor
MNEIISQNSTDVAYKKILDSILDFSLKPNEIITEIGLSEKLGLSRTPIRDAIRRLENDGLIVTQNRTKKVYFLTEKDVEEIFDLKIAIESLVAAQAAEKGTPGQIDTLSNLTVEIQLLLEKKSSGKIEDDVFFTEWLKTDEQFHDLLFEMSGNQRARQIIHMLNTQWHRIKVGLSAIEGRTEKGAVEHENIGKAIIQRNPEAAEKAVRTHLINLKVMLLKLMKAFNF